jgi:hypothetical protein
VRTARQTFRPFDVPSAVASFLDKARLRIGDSSEYVEAGSRRVLDVAELRAGDLTLEVAADETEFSDALMAAVAAAAPYGEEAVEFVVVVSSSYLKVAEVVARKRMADVERATSLKGNARPFMAIHHGCDVEAFLVLSDGLDQEPLRPWRKGTWLSRAAFALRTDLDGLGFTILPLTDEKRAELSLPSKTLRYTSLEESPLEAPSAATVTLYVDAELLAHLKKTPRKAWARAFTDQLAVDVLTAVAFRAARDPQIEEAGWESVEKTLMGSLLVMVGGRADGDSKQHYEMLLDVLRANPLDFLARIEGAVEMRDSAKLIVGSDQ